MNIFIDPADPATDHTVSLTYEKQGGEIKLRKYVLDPATLRMVPAPPRWYERLFNRIATAVASMVAMQKHVK